MIIDLNADECDLILKCIEYVADSPVGFEAIDCDDAEVISNDVKIKLI